jgi:hypothetical protein
MEDALPGAFYTTPTSLKLAHLALRVSRANVRRPCASPRKTNDFHRPGKISQETELRG